MAPQISKEEPKTFRGTNSFVTSLIPIDKKHHVKQTQHVYHGGTEEDVNPPTSNPRSSLRYRQATVKNTEEFMALDMDGE